MIGCHTEATSNTSIYILTSRILSCVNSTITNFDIIIAFDSSYETVIDEFVLANPLSKM